MNFDVVTVGVFYPSLDLTATLTAALTLERGKWLLSPKPPAVSVMVTHITRRDSLPFESVKVDEKATHVIHGFSNHVTYAVIGS